MWAPLLATLLLTLASNLQGPDAAPELRPGDVYHAAIGPDDPIAPSPRLDFDAGELPCHAQQVVLRVEQSGAYTLDLRSDAFDAYLRLRDEFGAVLAEDNDGLLFTHARLQVELAAGVTYRLSALALDGSVGEFELSFSAGHAESLEGPEYRAASIAEGERLLAIFEQRYGESRETARLLGSLADQHDLAGNAPQMLSCYERSLAMRMRVLGEGHHLTALAMNNVGTALVNMSREREGLEQLERSLELCLATWGELHERTALVLSNIGWCQGRLGRNADAKQSLRRAIAIREEVLGPSHEFVANALINLAGVHRTLREYDQARGLTQRALEIRIARRGEESIETAQALNNLAFLDYLIGAHDDARRRYDRALGIADRAGGPDHPMTSMLVENLVALDEMLGHYVDAVPRMQRVLADRTKKLGEDNALTARAANNLAHAHVRLGDPASARPLFERALRVLELTDSPEAPACKNNLGLLLLKLGERDRAAELLESVLVEREAKLGDHPDTALSLNNLGQVYAEFDDHAGALELFERAVSVARRVGGHSQLDTADYLTNRGVTLHALGDPTAARESLAEALAIKRPLLGDEHPSVAFTRSTIAAVELELGDPLAAVPMLEQALAVLRAEHGEVHRLTAESRRMLARALLDCDRPDTAWAVLRGGEGAFHTHVDRTLATLSEGEVFSYLSTLRSRLELELSLALRLPDERFQSEAYQTLLTWKGRGTRVLQASRARLWAELSAQQRETLADLQSCQAHLSSLSSGEEALDPAAREARLAELRTRRNELELRLQREFGTSRETPPFDAVQASLDAGEIAVDFFVHRVYEPARWRDGELVESGFWDEPRLSAWVFGPEGPPVHVDLGPAERVERHVWDHRRSMLPGVGAVASRGKQLPGPVSNVPADALRRSLWEPLAPLLRESERVYVSPDGFLGALPFETLRTADGGLAVERYAFVYVQDLASIATPRQPRSETPGLLSVGGVDFDGTTWAPLPGTASEAALVLERHARIFGERAQRLVFTGAEPSEARLKNEMPRFGILHLATHGFFRPERTTTFARHPGLLSGLVCARGSDEAEDGLLTAEEVGWLDLSGVELVVLSACETGLGLAESGEGMIGLRRAFRMAGARTVVSSLWSVPDEATRELMNAFYRNLWEEGLEPAEALRGAQLELLEHNRTLRGHDDPFTWGAFVLSDAGR